jgi:RNA polymerase sigma-70 factor, ECF subfamily
MSEEGDAELARAAAAGDEEAFAAIVTRYQRPVWSLCRRFVGEAEADDAAQEVFVRAFLHRERFDPSRPLAPWLLTIARRHCIDRLRRARLRPTPDADVEHTAAVQPDVESAAGARQELGRLAAALARLPEGTREAILLFHVEGLAYREIAEVLDVPIGTVMTWLHRGRKALAGAGGEP